MGESRVLFPTLVVFLLATFALLASSNLVAYYPFDEDPGTRTVTGTSGYCFYEPPEGSLQGNNDYSSSGGCVFGNCFRNNGPIDSANSMNLQGLKVKDIEGNRSTREGGKAEVPEDAFSIALWISNEDSFSDISSFGCLRRSSVFRRRDSVRLYLESDDDDCSTHFLVFEFESVGEEEETVMSIDSGYVGGWNGSAPGHFVWTYDSNANPPVNVYINGAFLRTDEGLFGALNSPTNRDFIVANELGGGGGGGSLDNAFEGYLDELYIFDHALTQAEINFLYNNNYYTPDLVSLNATNGATFDSFVDSIPVYNVDAQSSVTLEAVISNVVPSRTIYTWRAEQTEECEESFTVASTSGATAQLVAGSVLGRYLVTVCVHGDFLSASLQVYLNVQPSPISIARQPPPTVTLVANRVATDLYVEATGVPPPRYQWQFLTLIEDNSTDTNNTGKRDLPPLTTIAGDANSNEGGDANNDDAGNKNSHQEHASLRAFFAAESRHDDHETKVYWKSLARKRARRPDYKRGLEFHRQSDQNFTEVWVNFEEDTAKTSQFVFTPTLDDNGLVVRCLLIQPNFDELPTDRTAITVVASPDADGNSEGEGDGTDVAALAAGIAVPTGVVGLLGAIALCCCCILLCLVVIGLVGLCALGLAAVRRGSGGGTKLREPDYRLIAYDTLLEPMWSWSKKHDSLYEDLERFVVEHFEVLPPLLFSGVEPEHTDKLCQAMVHILDKNGLAYDLIQQEIYREAKNASSEGTLFRSNCVTSKLFTKYVLVMGTKYLWRLFANLLHTMDASIAPQEGTDIGDTGSSTFEMFTAIEVNPDKNSIAMEDFGDDLISVMELQLTAQKVLKLIISRRGDIPNDIKCIMADVEDAISQRPEFSSGACYCAVGGFFFLRYICPAILAPQRYGVSNVPLHPSTTRSLILLAKVLQNLANNTLPGEKEEYMKPLNDFITNNVARLEKFYSDVVRSRGIPSGRSANEPVVVQNCCAFLHHYLYNGMDRLIASSMDEHKEMLEELQSIVTAKVPCEKI